MKIKTLLLIMLVVLILPFYTNAMWEESKESKMQLQESSVLALKNEIRKGVQTLSEEVLKLHKKHMELFKIFDEYKIDLIKIGNYFEGFTTEINYEELEKIIKTNPNKSDIKEAIAAKTWLNKLNELTNDIDPSKKQVLKEISNSFRKNKFLPRETSDLPADIIESLEKLPNLMIESKIKEYFTLKYPGAKITILPKQGGDQFGKTVLIKTNEMDAKNFQYYVKTHQNGLQNKTQGSTTKPVDLKELFVYKFLELSGIGSEVHFFYDDVKYFYIATKNEGYSIDGSLSFITYAVAQNKDKNFYTNNQRLVQESFLLADFYTRLLLLDDVFSQGGNIGFVNYQGKYVDNVFKIIDFRTPKVQLTNYLLDGIYSGWETGNNYFSNSFDDLAREIIMSKKWNQTHTALEMNVEHLKWKKSTVRGLLSQNSLQTMCETNVNMAYKHVEQIAAPLNLSMEDLALYTSTVKEHCFILYNSIVYNQPTITRFFKSNKDNNSLK